MKRILTLTCLFLTLLLMGAFVFSVNAAPAPQLPQYATPTPGPDGKIIYIVAAGDSCLRIQLLTGVPMDQLKALNQLDENCTIFPDQKLVIGVGSPSGTTPTPNPDVPTPTPAPPTPVPSAGSAKVCVTLYDDANGDALRQVSENIIPGGAVSVTGALNPFSASKDTEGGADSSCFEEVPEGTYTISAAAPADYSPTTEQATILEIKAGKQIEVIFGAQKALKPVSKDPKADTGITSILGIFGVVLVLAALGLGGYYWYAYIRRPTQKSPPNPPGIAR